MSSWENDLPFIEPDEAVAAVKDGERLFVGSGCATPQRIVASLARRGSRLYDVEIIHNIPLGDVPYARPEFLDHFRHHSFFIGPFVRDAVNSGIADYTPISLSDVPRLFHRRILHIDTAIVQVTPPDAHGYCSLGVSVDIAKAAVENADRVIAEINPLMPRTHGQSFIHASRIDAFVRTDLPLFEAPVYPPDEAAQTIGQYVADLVEDGATIQAGVGRIPNAVLAALTGKRDLGMHTEMLSDGVLALIEAGVLNGRRKTLAPGKVVASFCFGSQRLYQFLHDNPLFDFRPSDFTNDPFIIARNARMVAINSAVEIDLTGQVAVDSIGPAFYGGFGGHLDFIRGAARSEGGKAIVALPSTARGGKISRIVPFLQEGAGVATTRADVHYVVTEFGVARLHGKSMRERAIALIHLAHPRFREQLLREARERRLLHPKQIALPPGLRPYPRKYEWRETLAGRAFLIRPIRPADERLWRDFFYTLTSETIVQRYFNRLRRLSHPKLQANVTLDYESEMALGIFSEGDGNEELVAVGQYSRNPATHFAEVSLIVRDQLQGHGLGQSILHKLIRVARENGIEGFTAQVLADNTPMLRLFSRLDLPAAMKLSDGVYAITVPFSASRSSTTPPSLPAEGKNLAE